MADISVGALQVGVQAQAVTPGSGNGLAKPATGVRQRLWTEVATVAVGQGITVIGTIAATRVITGALAPAAYGELALALTIAALLSVIGSGPVGNAVGRFYAVAHERGDLRCFFRSTLVLYGQYHVGLCSVTAVALLLYRSSHHVPPAWTNLGLIVIVLSLANGALALLDAMQNAARQRLVVAWHQAAGQWLRLGGAIAFIAWTGGTATSVLFGYTSASIAILGSQFLFFRLRLMAPANAELSPRVASVANMTREMRAYSNPFAAFAGVAWLQQSSDRWILASFGSATEVGLYQTMNQIGYSPLTQLSALISSVVGPILFTQAGDGTDSVRLHRARRHVRRLSSLMLLGTLILAGLLWLFGGPIFKFLVAAEYQGAAKYLPLAALAGGIFATGQMLATDAMLQMNSKALVAPKIGSAMVAIVLNYVGAKRFGVAGVVWAGVIASCVYALSLAAVTQRRRSAGPDISEES